MRPKIKLAQLIGSSIAHKAFGDECFYEWARKLSSHQKIALKDYEKYGVDVFDYEKMTVFKGAEVLYSAGSSLEQVAESFRQLGEAMGSNFGVAFSGFAEAVTSVVAPFREQYERHQRDVIYLRLITLSLFGWHFMPNVLCVWISENYPLDWTPAAIRNRFGDLRVGFGDWLQS